MLLVMTVGFSGCVDKDTDGDGTPDSQDQCPQDASKTKPGECGCGVAESDIDSNGNGIPDCQEQCLSNKDTDGDGTPDCKDKCPKDSSCN